MSFGGSMKRIILLLSILIFSACDLVSSLGDSSSDRSYSKVVSIDTNLRSLKRNPKPDVFLQFNGNINGEDYSITDLSFQNNRCTIQLQYTVKSEYDLAFNEGIRIDYFNTDIASLRSFVLGTGRVSEETSPKNGTLSTLNDGTLYSYLSSVYNADVEGAVSDYFTVEFVLGSSARSPVISYLNSQGFDENTDENMEQCVGTLAEGRDFQLEILTVLDYSEGLPKIIEEETIDISDDIYINSIPYFRANTDQSEFSQPIQFLDETIVNSGVLVESFKKTDGRGEINGLNEDDPINEQFTYRITREKINELAVNGSFQNAGNVLAIEKYSIITKFDENTPLRHVEGNKYIRTKLRIELKVHLLNANMQSTDCPQGFIYTQRDKLVGGDDPSTTFSTPICLEENPDPVVTLCPTDGWSMMDGLCVANEPVGQGNEAYFHAVIPSNIEPLEDSEICGYYDNGYPDYSNEKYEDGNVICFNNLNPVVTTCENSFAKKFEGGLRSYCLSELIVDDYKFYNAQVLEVIEGNHPDCSTINDNQNVLVQIGELNGGAICLSLTCGFAKGCDPGGPTVTVSDPELSQYIIKEKPASGTRPKYLFAYLNNDLHCSLIKEVGFMNKSSNSKFPGTVECEVSSGEKFTELCNQNYEEVADSEGTIFKKCSASGVISINDIEGEAFEVSDQPFEVFYKKPQEEIDNELFLEACKAIYGDSDPSLSHIGRHQTGAQNPVICIAETFDELSTCSTPYLVELNIGAESFCVKDVSTDIHNGINVSKGLRKISTETDCSLIPNSIEDNNQCICPEGFSEIQNNGFLVACYEESESTPDCSLVENSMLDGSTNSCTCMSGYLPVSDNAGVLVACNEDLSGTTTTSSTTTSSTTTLLNNGNSGFTFLNEDRCTIGSETGLAYNGRAVCVTGSGGSIPNLEEDCSESNTHAIGTNSIGSKYCIRKSIRTLGSGAQIHDGKRIKTSVSGDDLVLPQLDYSMTDSNIVSVQEDLDILKAMHTKGRLTSYIYVGTYNGISSNFPLFIIPGNFPKDKKVDCEDRGYRVHKINGLFYCNDPGSSRDSDSGRLYDIVTLVEEK